VRQRQILPVARGAGLSPNDSPAGRSWRICAGLQCPLSGLLVSPLPHPICYAFAWGEGEGRGRQCTSTPNPIEGGPSGVLPLLFCAEPPRHKWLMQVHRPWCRGWQVTDSTPRWIHASLMAWRWWARAGPSSFNESVLFLFLCSVLFFWFFWSH
jgi:hypothetical protein